MSSIPSVSVATKVKDEAARLCEAITKIVEASQNLSDKCHTLQLHTVARTEEATHAESETQSKDPTNGFGRQQTDFRVRRKLRVVLRERRHGNKNSSAGARIRPSYTKITPAVPERIKIK